MGRGAGVRAEWGARSWELGMREERTGRTRGSLLHSRVVRGIGVHGRATLLDRLGAQLEVPGLVTVDLAQPIIGAIR